MAAHPKKERSLVIIKPDGVQRALLGEIISRFERTGLKFITMKLLVPKAEQCWTHYNKDDEWFLKKGARIVEDRKAHGMPIEKEVIEYGKDIIQANVDFFPGPVLAMVIEGNQSVAIVKRSGGTESTTRMSARLRRPHGGFLRAFEPG
jgi:nucleoside-diphosphate kinase